MMQKDDDDPLAAFAPRTLTARILDATGWSHQAFADLMGVSRSTVTYWCRTDRESFTHAQLYAIRWNMRKRAEALADVLDSVDRICTNI